MCEPTRAELRYVDDCTSKKDRVMANKKYYRKHAQQVKRRSAINKMINMRVAKMYESKIVENKIKEEDVEKTRQKALEKHIHKLTEDEINDYFNDLCKRVKMVWKSHEKLKYAVQKRGYNRHHKVGNKMYVLIPQTELE